ncbi:MAG: M56 family metallopeptidase [Bacteroidota bacterium]
MNFWIEFSLILLLCYAYYLGVLAKQTRFQFNRLFLMAMIPLSALLAYLSIPLRGTPEVLAVFSLPEISIGALSEDSANAGSEFNWWYLYLAGVLISACISLLRLFQLWRFIRRHPLKKDGPYVLVQCGLKDSPASFFKYIFWNDAVSDAAEERAQILAHEQCHVEQKHSLDRLAFELMLILCWFHPLVYLIRRDLLQTHEFLADRAATQDGNIRNYASLLLSRAFSSRLRFSHSFFHSPVKSRIMMLQNSASRNMSLRYWGLLPLLGLMVLLFACQPERSESQEVIAETNTESPQSKDLIQVDKEPEPINLREIRRAIGYPKIARDANIQGLVVARILIDEKGQYVEHEIISSAHEILGNAVEAQLSKLEMIPAIKDDKPVQFWINVPFNFKLIE